MSRTRTGSSFWIISAFLALSAIMTVPIGWAKPTVERVSITARSDDQGFVIRFHLDSPVGAYSEPRMIERDRVEMILFNAGISDTYIHDEAEGPIADYLEEEAGGHVIFRFNLDSPRPLAASAYRDRGSNDLLMGLTYTSEQAPTVAEDSGSAPEAPFRTASLARDAEPVAPNETTTRAVSSEGARWMLDTIVIDPGHGGRDPGAVANGVREKDVVLGTALMLGEYLEQNLGVNVYYTRDDDRFIELSDRGKIANTHGGKLFISIHANSASSSRAHGTETFFLGMHKSDAARRTMELENSVVQLESDPDQYKNMDEESLIRMELTRSAYMRNSEAFAGGIERQFADRVGRTSRGVKQAGFYVLWGASMPAVLVELGFLTNKNESEFLRSERGQAYMASAIFRAVRDYKQQYEKGLSHVSGN